MTVTRSEYPEDIADRLPKEETDRTIASDKVEGTVVYNAQDEKIGTVHNVMIDKYSGQVEYAVMSFGGFLGIGERYHPLPWKLLRYDERLDGYVVGIKKEALETGPSFARNAMPSFDRSYGMGVYGHYGLFP
ncbi:PRC-barrel domain-containing protein [Sphingobium sp. BS19]|uniref:PRC-barrel domain-containing protein n=1 Tax=Sphingobium sp. BS19 TaxID=3018973 RepID=UPI0022EDF672|nr:PRC-barrel domain-containing protein [Sphingobium sp. BS19]GLI98966.1 photosystem reaction center subunit H [Sphingobium sp. BS19]